MDYQYQCFPIQITGWPMELMAYAYLAVSPSSMRGKFEEMVAAVIINSKIPVHAAVSREKEATLCFKQWDLGGSCFSCYRALTGTFTLRTR